jgi:WD40 repeat protein
VKRIIVLACSFALIGCTSGPLPQSHTRSEVDEQNAKPLPSTHRPPPPFYTVNGAAFSPDGKLACTTYAYYGENPVGSFRGARAWNVATGLELASFCQNSVFSLRFLPDSKRVIFKPRDRKLQICEALTGKLLSTFEDSSRDTYLLGLSPDGKLALTRDGAGQLSLIDVKTEKLVAHLEGRSGRDAAQAVFTPDGNTVYVGLAAREQDYDFGVWAIPSGKLIRFARRGDYELYPLAFSPDGKLGLSQTPEDRQSQTHQRLVLWDQAGGAELRWLRGRSANPHPATPFSYPSVYCAGFSGDGRRVIAILGDWTLRSWEVATGTEVWSVRVDDELLTACAISPDGRHVLTASRRQIADFSASLLRIRLWDATGGHFLHALAGPDPSLPQADPKN